VLSKGDMTKARVAAAKRARSPKEPCVGPDKLLHRLEVGPNGAMVVSFSHSGMFMYIHMIMHYISRSFISFLVMPLLGRVYVFYVRI
jgi:hypothetical protein